MSTQPISSPKLAPDLAGFADPVSCSSEDQPQTDATQQDQSQEVEEAERKTVTSKTEPAALACVPGGDYDYVIGSPDEHFEGIFVRGDVNLVAGLSGSGKSTLLIKWLAEERKEIPILDRPTFGLPYIVCLEDRSQRSFRRTLRRLGISETDIPVRRIDSKLPLAQWLEITIRTEKVRPAIVFIEGLDLALAKHKDMDEVSTVMRQLGGIAEHHHIAIIGSVGCPKLKKNEDYDSLRSKVIGSTAWGRKAETIILLSREKDTDKTTTMYVLYRHRAVEVISLQFEDGHFVVAPPEATASGSKTDNEDLLTAWSRTKTGGLPEPTFKLLLTWDGLLPATCWTGWSPESCFT